MPEQLPANSGKSRSGVARMNCCGERIEHREHPALVLEPEEGSATRHRREVGSIPTSISTYVCSWAGVS